MHYVHQPAIISYTKEGFLSFCNLDFITETVMFFEFFLWKPACTFFLQEGPTAAPGQIVVLFCQVSFTEKKYSAYFKIMTIGIHRTDMPIRIPISNLPHPGQGKLVVWPAAASQASYPAPDFLRVNGLTIFKTTKIKYPIVPFVLWRPRGWQP